MNDKTCDCIVLGGLHIAPETFHNALDLANELGGVAQARKVSVGEVRLAAAMMLATQLKKFAERESIPIEEVLVNNVDVLFDLSRVLHLEGEKLNG